MESDFRTPLLECFRQGDAPRDVRLLAAQGGLAPRAHEQLGLLMILVADTDEEIARAAEATLQAIAPGSIEGVLAGSNVPAEMRAFFEARGVTPAEAPATEIEVPLLDTGGPTEPEAAEGTIDGGAVRPGMTEKIAAMNVPERLKLAMKGTREERAVLIRDPNRMVAAAVLSSPKLSESEVTSIARMGNVSEEILRIIGHTRAWIKNYSTCLALVKNSKTPLALSMNLLSRLNEKDLRMLSIDRNVPDTLRITARKKITVNK
ncbi:MAG: hypothetical protein ABL993_03415 [Vicinamibacterales bacterium]